MRGLLVEFGVHGPAGSARFLNTLHQLLADRKDALPVRVRRTVTALWEEVRDLEQRIENIDTELESIALEQPAIQALLTIPGIGLLTATALFAAVADVHAFKSGRHLACWLGLTPRENSSGKRRRLGRISKLGDPYIRTLLVHGARAALNAARRRASANKPVTQLQAWSLERARSAHPNRATVAIANKLARIAWAVWFHDRTFDGNHVQRAAA
jgi:transposase